MYQNRNTLYAPVLVACFIHVLCALSGSVFRGAYSSLCWWLVLCSYPPWAGSTTSEDSGVIHLESERSKERRLCCWALRQ